MGEYTSSLSNKGCDISPEDENYKQELLNVVKSFRTFDAALDEFIVQKGYSGDIADIDAKVKFIKEQFDRAGVPLETRILRGWFQRHTQADKREIAIKFCFAFQLTLQEARESDKLFEHCAEIDEAARSRMELIVPELAKQYGVTEQLKVENQMEWVRQMNACKAQAEEVVKAELIYD